ncbi:hypothetical protein AB1N83_013005 [Pleurotus pulmonarius]
MNFCLPSSHSQYRHKRA